MLGLFSAGAIVVGGVIGSGIFIVPSQVAKATEGYVGLILLLWFACGVVNLCGALTLAELSAMFPQAGGTYVFLREAYGGVWAYLWAWAEFWVIRSGAIAALAVAMTMSLVQLVADAGIEVSAAGAHTLQQVVAIAAIVVLAMLNMLGTRLGGGVQNLTTVIKALFVAVLALLPWMAVRSESVELAPWFPATWSVGLWAGIGTALAGIMWAYDGWGMVTVVAEEIKRPERNVPLALGGGVLLLTLLYTGANLGYHLTLPSDRIAEAMIPAADVSQVLWGAWGQKLMLGMLMVSIFGALNSNVLVGPRVIFAVARDNAFLGPLRHIDPRTGTPAISIAALSLWSCALVLLGDFSPDQSKSLFEVLINYTIFGGSMFYFAAVWSVFIFRRRRPDWPRPYRTWGYPYVPAIFIGFYVCLLGSMLWASLVECLTGLLLIALGLPPYLLARRRYPGG